MSWVRAEDSFNKQVSSFTLNKNTDEGQTNVSADTGKDKGESKKTHFGRFNEVNYILKFHWQVLALHQSFTDFLLSFILPFFFIAKPEEHCGNGHPSLSI